MPDRAGRSALEGAPLTETGVLAACFNDHGEILLVRHRGSERIADGLFGLPGGQVEEGESAGAAALRELEEETGIVGNPNLTFTLPRIWVSNFERPNGTKAAVSLQVWLVFSWEGQLRETKTGQPAFVPLRHVGALPLLPNVLSMTLAAFELYSYCWALAAEQAGVALPPGAETLLNLAWQEEDSQS